MIHFYSADVQVPSFLRKKTREALVELFNRESVQLKELSYIFCSDEYLLGINRSFLSHDFYTDIITFDLSEDRNAIYGEIYISVERVKDNASKLNQPLKKELMRVIFHGALHLCGFKDKTAGQQKEMRKMEDLYLKQYFN